MFGIVALRVLSVFALALCARAQPATPLSPDTILLARVKRHMREMLLRQVNYTCQLSIERSTRSNPRRNYKLVDSVRLEVALVNGKELYSWPGARSFDDRELREMIGGTTSTGSFALHARAVFFGTAPIFRYNGEQTRLDGQRVHEWSFEVSQMASSYVIRTGTPTGLKEGIVGYRGTIQIHPDTLDLIQLQFEAVDPPPHLTIQSAGDTIGYSRLRIGESEYLLPTSSDLRMTDLSGNESRNRTRFHNCRQYGGESVISFDEPPPETAKPEAPKPLPQLPAGMGVELELVKLVLLSEVAIGERIEAVLARAGKHKGVEYLPKGALFSGRILGVHSLPGRTVPTKAVSLVFDRVESNNQSVDVTLTLDDVAPAQLGAIRFSTNRGPGAVPSGESIIFVQGNRMELIRGLRMFWTVQKPSAANGKSSALP